MKTVTLCTDTGVRPCLGWFWCLAAYDTQLWCAGGRTSCCRGARSGQKLPSLMAQCSRKAEAEMSAMERAFSAVSDWPDVVAVPEVTVGVPYALRPARRRKSRAER